MTTGRSFLGSCANGAKVYSRLDDHNKVHPVESSLLQEAFLKISPVEDFIVTCVDFGRVIGKTTCVNVDETDSIVMAYRHGRKGPTPMVLNRQPLDCSCLRVILKKDQESGDYILITAFFGYDSEKEPWDPSLIPGSVEYQRAKAFWATHALVYDPSTIARMA